ncbi:MAG: hypothetical protein AAGB10_00320 [Pseudomonadota bacterium]
MILKPSAGIIAVSENALALIFWQSTQWHATVKRGLSDISIRVAEQRHVPPAGRFGGRMPHLHVLGKCRFETAKQFQALGRARLFYELSDHLGVGK